MLRVKVALARTSKKQVSLTITMIEETWRYLLKLLNIHNKNDRVIIITIINVSVKIEMYIQFLNMISLWSCVQFIININLYNYFYLLLRDNFATLLLINFFYIN